MHIGRGISGVVAVAMLVAVAGLMFVGRGQAAPTLHLGSGAAWFPTIGPGSGTNSFPAGDTSC